MILKGVLFILPFFLLNLAGTCDTYVRGMAWIHKNNGDDEATPYEGCKKGCFYNGTVTENGVVKCEKCSAIEDQQFCEDRSSTCFWTKGGKCRATSCPEMVQTLNKQNGRARYLLECLEGTPEQKFYNELSWNDVDSPHQCDYLTPECRKKLCDLDYTDEKYNDQLAIYEALDPSTWEGNYYGSAKAYADYWRADGLQSCLDTYENSKRTCVNNYGYRRPQLSHIDTKAAREACHKISGCMYSAGNGRCSYWSVWAFVVTLVVCVVVVVAVVLVVIVVLLKDKVKSAA